MGDATLLQRIADGLGERYPQSAELARDPDTDVRRYALAFPFAGGIYRVRYLGPYHDVVFFVGMAERAPERVFMLTGQPEAFNELLQAAGTTVGEPRTAVAYVRAWIETTRDMRDLLYVVSTVDELQFLPNPDNDPERAAAIAACRAAWGPVIAPPLTSDDALPCTVRLYVVREQALERHDVTVDAGGPVSSAVEVLAEEMPLVFSR